MLVSLWNLIQRLCWLNRLNRIKTLSKTTLIMLFRISCNLIGKIRCVLSVSRLHTSPVCVYVLWPHDVWAWLLHSHMHRKTLICSRDEMRRTIIITLKYNDDSSVCFWVHCTLLLVVNNTIIAVVKSFLEKLVSIYTTRTLLTYLKYTQVYKSSFFCNPDTKFRETPSLPTNILRKYPN